MDILDDLGVNYQQKFFLKVNYSFKKHFSRKWFFYVMNLYFQVYSLGSSYNCLVLPIFSAKSNVDVKYLA